MKTAVVTAGYQAILRPLLFRSFGGDAETIHEEMISALGAMVGSPVSSIVKRVVGSVRCGVDVAGIFFPGRVGVAAGLDKDGVAAGIWSSLGFGFAELGTVTAQAQPGNPRPRVFRLKNSAALINRMGFNNHGAGALAHRLEEMGVKRGEATLGIPLGISIGKTKIVEVDEVIGDYLESLEAVHPYADYVAVNISSPNTPGLRGLQEKTHVYDLVSALVGKAGECGGVPIFVKVAPDLTDCELDDLLESVVNAGGSGLIATNTTLSREGIVPADLGLARQTGGLSGGPVTLRARQMVARAMTSGLPVIASGGIMTAGDAQAMFDLGASLVQVYTGFIYSGPGLVAQINDLPSASMKGRS
ncbi:MAG: quinone-dependent dihydroorotate dehydrogenase [Propionibacteriaceae bacterium]|nr:quinone-dependent dihydroorotate dehydrogenase [Propionibacteriaceae bacterium]